MVRGVVPVKKPKGEVVKKPKLSKNKKKKTGKLKTLPVPTTGLHPRFSLMLLR